MFQPRTIVNTSNSFSNQGFLQGTSSSNLCKTKLFPQYQRLHSEGDADLVKYLHEEISYEENHIVDVPTIENFSVSMDGTLVSLTRVDKGEQVHIVFNINNNIRENQRVMCSLRDTIDQDDDIDDAVEDEEDVGLLDTTYPTFKVTISKDSGSTLCFQCALNTNIDEDFHTDNDDEHINDYMLTNTMSPMTITFVLMTCRRTTDSLTTPNRCTELT